MFTKGHRKSLLLLLVLLSVPVLLSGCLRYNISTAIHKDKSMDFEMVIAMSDQLLAMAGSDAIDMSNAAENGFEVKPYSQDGYSGSVVSRSVPNIDYISGPEPVTVSLDTDSLQAVKQLFQVEKGFLKNRYIAHFIVDMTKAAEGYSDDEMGMAEAAFQSMDLKYVLSLDMEPLSCDGKLVSNENGVYVYQWDFSFEKPTEINYEFEIGNGAGLFKIAGMVLGALVLTAMIIVGIVMLTKKSRKMKLIGGIILLSAVLIGCVIGIIVLWKSI